MQGFLPKSQETKYNCFYTEKTEKTQPFLCETHQHGPLLRQIILWYWYENRPLTPTQTIRANKGLLYNYRRFQDLSKSESNQLLWFNQETEQSEICLPLSNS